jgi:ATP-dependent RNA helicase RhlE
LSFTNFNLHPTIMDGVQASGYTVPTPIQKETIPPIMQGRDIIGLAQTGTGKTAAFVLPLMHRLLQLPRRKIGALIISPTRELAEQTCEAIDMLGRKTGIRSIAVYGGVGMDQQVRRLREGVDVVVACPGRLLDHIWKGTINLQNVEILVIDEADRMFDMGFLPDIKSILKCLVNPRQTLLFSATMPNDIRKLVKDVLHEPVTVQIGQTAPAASVSHALYPVKQHLKASLLVELLRRKETESVLVFTRTKRRADNVYRRLRNAGYKVEALHGDLSQGGRQAALDGFRSGKYKILVATDIAARGIDVLSISHVVNFDMPDTTDAYIHRIGRTGRVNNSGEAFTLVTSDDAAMIKEIENVLHAPLERIKLEGFDYNMPAPEVTHGPGREFKRGPAREVNRAPARPGRRPVSSASPQHRSMGPRQRIATA